jgi:hypothetical protein
MTNDGVHYNNENTWYIHLTLDIVQIFNFVY